MIRQLSRTAAFAAMMTLVGCGMTTPSGPDQHESKSVELGKAEEVRVQIKMNAGELNVNGGATKLMNADFTFNVAAWEPEIDYDSSGTAGTLTVMQPGPKSSSGNTKNRWDLRLNDAVPMDLKIQLGAGESHLNLGSLKLRDLDFQLGAGELNLDLRGKPAKDYNVRVQGGAGDATVYLPKDVGVSATVTGGLGEVSVTGLHKEGDHYVNDAYGHASVQIKLEITGGVGSVKLIG
jgi:hypothetical protein